jgi:hypothetical protein
MKNKQSSSREWFHYEETSRNTSPVKIDRTLEQRLKAFLRARKVKSEHLSDNV